MFWPLRWQAMGRESAVRLLAAGTVVEIAVNDRLEAADAHV
jgi:hypothetical protein